MSKHLHNLKRQLLADKKKLGVMVVLAFFGLLMWGRLLLKDVPRVATARPNPAAQAAPQPSDKAEPAPRRTSRVEVVRVEPRQKLSRDLFVFDPSRYKRTLTPGAGENLFSPDNSRPQPADDMLGVTETLDQARSLVLQSVVTGSRPRAVVNDRLIAPGDWIEGFELLDVVDRYVHLEKNGIVIRLWM